MSNYRNARPKSPPKLRHLGLKVPADLYMKLERIAEAEDRSVSAVVRRLLASATDPNIAEAV